MGANLQEWEFFVTNRATSSGGSPAEIDDDSGKVFVMDVGTANAPAVYTDQSGTALTKIAGNNVLSLTNGHVRFWTDRTTTALDVAWFGSSTCGYLKNVGPSRHELTATVNGGVMSTVIPINNTSAFNAETSMGFSFPNGIFVQCTWAVVTSAGSNTLSTAFDLGIAASAAGGDANGFLLSQQCSALRKGSRSALGVLSRHAISGLDQQLTYTPHSAVHSGIGALVYFDVQYPTS